MTEAEWLTGGNDYTLFQFIRRKADRRKLRLFACACCRRIWELMPDERSRIAVQVSERYADGWATKGQLSAAQAAAAEAVRDAVEASRAPEAVVFSGCKGLTAEQREVAWAAFHLATKYRAAARAAKAVARSTDRFSKMAEEIGLAETGCVGRRLQVSH